MDSERFLAPRCARSDRVSISEIAKTGQPVVALKHLSPLRRLVAVCAGLLELPEEPHTTRAQEDDDEQQQEGLIGSGKMVHAPDKAPPMPSVPRGALHLGQTRY
ncbi:hypothetical protein Q2941_12615 [Bradyrhizobium sp. UFLA05-153]|uniref:hypothetical protein n=1 Tax=Bradyrhizobium sp. Ec3.3 TaxID=189753 RepID=UPI0012EBB0F5|nr:hypothetical protein [Bradyrhizobium sp. Ec3.3]